MSYSKVSIDTSVPAIPTRFWELDALRGIALILMSGFHLLFLVWFLQIRALSIFTTPLSILGPLAATLFIVVAGVAAAVRYQRYHRSTSVSVFDELFWHGLRILGWGMVVTVVTILSIPDYAVFFGILHFLGISIMISRWFIQMPLKLLAVISVLWWLLGQYLSNLTYPGWQWLVLGVSPPDFTSLDYYPLFPWFALILGGIVLGRLLYPGGKRCEWFNWVPAQPPIVFKAVVWLGQHTLLWYLIHIPLFLGIFWSIGLWKP